MVEYSNTDFKSYKSPVREEQTTLTQAQVMTFAPQPTLQLEQQQPMTKH